MKDGLPVATRLCASLLPTHTHCQAPHSHDSNSVEGKKHLHIQTIAHMVMASPLRRGLSAGRHGALSYPGIERCGAAFPRDMRTKAAQFRPCIDIHQGRVKQIIGGSLQDAEGASSAVENFTTERPASEYASMYSRDNLTGGHVIQLGGDSETEAAARDALSAYPGGLQLGGGVNPTNAGAWLDAGASALIVTSYAFSQGRLHEERLASLVRQVGKRRLVLDLSCRRRDDGHYYVVTDRWQKFTDVRVDGQALAELGASCAEYLVHGVDVEGLRLGVDERLVEMLGQVSSMPVTYAGGVRSLDDMELVRQVGNGNVNVTVGSALDIFGGDLSYGDVVSWHRRQQHT